MLRVFVNICHLSIVYYVKRLLREKQSASVWKAGWLAAHCCRRPQMVALFFFRRAGTATTVALNALCVMKMNVWCFLSSRELISVLQADYWQTLRQEGGSTATFSQLLVWCFSPLSWTSDDEADGEPIRNVQTTEKDDVRAKQVQKKTMPTTNTIETQSRAFSLQIGQTSLKL